MQPLPSLKFPLILLSLFASLPSVGALAEQTSYQQDQQALNLTVYNQDLALIRDTRRVTLKQGVQDLAWRDVSAQLRAETALLNAGHAARNPAAIRLLEQNFDFDLLSPQKLLEKQVGQKVRIIRTHPGSGAESTEEATLLAANDGVVLQFADRIETHPPGRLAFQTLPQNLRDRPTLVMRLDAQTAGPQILELSYLSAGLSWQADYVGELAADESMLELAGWVTLSNHSGTSYPNARLQLVAGDVQTVRNAMQDRARRAQPMMLAAAPAMQEETLFDYHLYTLDQPTDIKDHQSKQLALLNASHIPVKKEYLLTTPVSSFRSSTVGSVQKLNIDSRIEFVNQGGQLGIPLPRGVLRLYKKDSQGAGQFIGEDRIDHTARNQTVRAKLGSAFDLSAERRQTDYKRLSATGPGQMEQSESAYAITVRNAKDQAVKLRIHEALPHDWQILEESQPHSKTAAHEAQWLIDIPAGGQTTLSYRVRIKQ